LDELIRQQSEVLITNSVWIPITKKMICDMKAANTDRKDVMIWDVSDYNGKMYLKILTYRQTIHRTKFFKRILRRTRILFENRLIIYNQKNVFTSNAKFSHLSFKLSAQDMAECESEILVVEKTESKAVKATNFLRLIQISISMIVIAFVMLLIELGMKYYDKNRTE